MIQPMAPGAERPLTDGEWSSLSRGLAEALRAAGAEPTMFARLRPRLPRGGPLGARQVPIMVLGYAHPLARTP